MDVNLSGFEELKLFLLTRRAHSELIKKKCVTRGVSEGFNTIDAGEFC